MEPRALRARLWAAFGGILLATAALSGAQVAPLVIVTPLDATQAASQESNLGNLVSDAVRDKAHAQIAIVPANELQPVIVPAGRVDSSVLVDALKAASDNSDTVVALRLTGAQIKKALLHGLSRLPGPYAGFLQISGIRVVYDSTGRSTTIASVILEATGEKLADDQSYTVATSRLLADGALGYFDVWEKSDIALDTGVPLAKAVSDYAAAHQPVDYRVEGRITSK